MSFMGKFAKFFGIIRVKTINNQVRVTGIDALIMKKYIRKIFETDANNKKMFTTIGDTHFTFHQFFIPDIVYILTKVRMDPKTKWSVRNSIDKIIQGFLTETWFKSSIADVKPMIDPKRMNVLKWKPLPKQEAFLHLYGDRIPRYDLRGYILALAPGLGKSIGIDDKIRTPNGWVRNGDISKGDVIVVPDGTTAKVSGVYPQGFLDMYKVTFEDGRSVECSDDHLWKIYNRYWCNGPGSDTRGSWKVLPFKDIRISLQLHPNVKLYVPIIVPEIKPDVDLPVDPYILGVLLGDGCLSGKSITVTKPDPFIREELERLLPLGMKVSDFYKCGKTFGISGKDNVTNKSLLSTLEDLGLKDTVSYTKFIPDTYLNASFSQRLSLLQGLLDTDGTVGVSPGRGNSEKTPGKGGSVQFCTTSHTLALQVQELVRSIGGLCKLRNKQPKYTYKGHVFEGRLAYILFIRYPRPRDLFRLPRKRELTSEYYQYEDVFRLRIRNVEYVGKKEAQCISVDHPDSLYITNDYIVTHNTFTDLLVASCVIPPSIAEVKIVISPKKALHLVWEDSVKNLFKKTPTYWCSDSSTPMPLTKNEYYIFTYEAMDMAMELVKKLSARNIRYFIIVDESHNFADPRSARTQKLVNIQTYRDDTYFIWTTGTPLLKLGTELISFLKCADPRFDAEAERRFKSIFSTSKGRANEIFNHRLGQMMAYMVSKAEVSDTKPTIKELPIKLPTSLSNRFLMSTVREDMRKYIEERVLFYQKDMNNLRSIVNKWLEYHKGTLTTKDQERAFDRYLKDLKVISRNPDKMISELQANTRRYERMFLLPSLPPMERKSFKNALSAIKNIKLKVRGEALGKVLARRRAECAAALGLYCKPEQILKESLSKTLFFASSVYPVETLAKDLERKGFKPARVYGENNKDLTKIMTAFKTDPELNPICATMQSLSEAVPVIEASTIVLLNRPFRQAMFEQIVARADRNGQIHPVTVIEPTLDTGNEPNVSSRTDEILSEVRTLISELVGNDFAGPDPEDRVYLPLIDAAEEDPILQRADEIMGL